MTITLVNFATPEFYHSQKVLNISASRHDIQTISFNEKTIIKSKYYKECKHILAYPRGAGYWLWKAMIILEAFEKVNTGDIIIYADSGIEILSKLDILYEICRQQGGILLFNNFDYPNCMWTKRDCFILMDCDQEKYWTGLHLDAAFQIYIKNDASICFINECLKYGKNPNIITDLPNTTTLSNFDIYKEHRWDQSILSLLAIKHNLEIFRMPSQFGNYYKLEEFKNTGEVLYRNHSEFSNSYSNTPYVNSPYSTLLNHHRTKTNPGLFKRILHRYKPV